MASERTSICEGCGSSYIVQRNTRGRYCSNACKRNRVQKTCPGCGKSFEVSASKAAKFRYCSLACRRAAHPTVMKTCPQCDASFPLVTHRGAVPFCSVTCRLAAARVTYSCARCGKERTVPRNRMTPARRCCSNRCATLLRMDEGFEPGYLAEKRRTGRRTDIEAMAEAVLIELGIAYDFEKKIGRWSVDFALPDLSVALECDGWQHAWTSEKDAHRDAALAAKGWTVVRVPDKALRTDARAAVTTALQPHREPAAKTVER